MIQRFRNITDHINQQQETIPNYLKHTQEMFQNKIKTDNINLKFIQYLNEINCTIDLLDGHLANIAQFTKLTRLNIIPKHILN